MSREYFNRMAAVWDEVAAEKDGEKLKHLVQRLDIMPGDCVLDIGTGTGIIIPYLLERIGGTGRLIALDYAEEMLRRARAKGFQGNVDFLHADIADVPLADGTFDAAVCYSCFPHFRDKGKALAETHRLLRSGGRLFICHTSGREQINRIHQGIPSLAGDILPDGVRMEQLLLEAGFGEITVAETTEDYFVRAVRV